LEGTDRQIVALATIENTVFVGTPEGLYRINPRHNSTTDIWEKLPLTTTKVVHSLATAENNLYVGTGPDFGSINREQIHEELSAGQSMWEVFRSTDLGNSWTEITPTTEPVLRLFPGIKVLTAGKTLWALGYTGFQCRSTDAGKTWTDHGYKKLDPLSMMNSFMLSVSPAVGINENILFKASPFGLIRSTDAGESWQPFMTGIVGTRIFNLIAFKNALYGNTGTNIAKSTDGGLSWNTVRFAPHTWTPKSELDSGSPLFFSRLVVADGELYGITTIPDIKDALRIFHLSTKGSTLALIQDFPSFRANLSIETPETQSQETSKQNSTDDLANNADQASQSSDTTHQTIAYPRRFAVDGDRFYVEYKQRLFRWRRGEPGWVDTGLIDTAEVASEDITKRSTIAVSGETVYVGKRNGHLLRSFDAGNTWEDVTSMLPLRFQHFKEIAFVNSSVYVATNAGVLTSEDGENWRTITDTEGTHTVIDRIAIADETVYSAGDTGVYQLDDRGRWEQILPAVPNRVISLVINADQLYIATERSGMFHASLEKEND
ncbi:hypothetical protein J5I95_05360, partial [Candidatus Poribacteria bacterium]|nr:hypothetical protein [Candidatus Poribacteria bacterium]